MVFDTLGKLARHQKRFIKLAGMTASVTGSYAQNRAKRLLLPNQSSAEDLSDLYRMLGNEIADTLGELKGAAMKVGQIASQVKDLLPPEITDALEKLQKAAPPMAFSVIEEQIRRELGAAPQQLFAWIDSKPFAAASIGQVHRARTHEGYDVIVKIQYPDVAQSCDSDLFQLKLLLQMGRLVKIQGQVLDKLFEEIKARIHEELDYVNEANNIRFFRQFHQTDKNIVIPQVIDGLSSRQVLTLTYEPGDPIDDVKSPRYSQGMINQLGRQLFQTMAKQLFLLHAVHADPQPGNFAFRPDGSIVMYDFGCVKKLDLATVEAYRQAVTAFLEADYAGLDHAMQGLGFRTLDGPAIGAEYYARWRNILIQPFLADQPFDFGTSTLHEEIIRYSPEVLKRLESFQPAAEVVYIDRMLGGHYWTLSRLGVKASFLAELSGLLQQDFNVAPLSSG